MKKTVLLPLLLLFASSMALGTTMFKPLSKEALAGQWYALDWESGFAATMRIGEDQARLSITGGEAAGEFVFDLTNVDVQKGILRFVATSKKTGLMLQGKGTGGAEEKCGEVVVRLKKVNRDNPNDLLVKEFVFLKLDSGGDRLNKLAELMNRASELAKGTVEPCCGSGKPVRSP